MFRAPHLRLSLIAASAVLALSILPASAQAPTSATADLNVKGVEDVIAALQARKGDRNSAQAALFLTLMKQIGRPGPVANGRTSLDYKVTTTPDGGVLVNGIDIIPIINTASKLGASR
ncbi:hypothetical protein ACFSM5_21580 [Lacibacterium aquatile]|uniref:Uncharacterized protein n=1 Tax=Lacibacterium aquatile TaxID=1168082 RepID=A0ABW5DWL9_9PROT